MISLWHQFRPACAALMALLLLGCGAYPFAVWVIGQTVFPHRANGSLVPGPGGDVCGSELLGQPFQSAGYFHSRPSAAGSGYEATHSGGSNQGPTSARLRVMIRERVAQYRRWNGLGPEDPVPADAVTASASGLDPHISVRNARLQAARVARVRGIPEAQALKLVARFTESPVFGVLGDPRVPVLPLNLALDSLRAGAVPSRDLEGTR